MPDLAPHTETEIAVMLADLGLSSVVDLHRSIPEPMRIGGPLNLNHGLSEVEVIEEMADYAQRNLAARRDLVVYAGGGAYDHDSSVAARALGSLPNFVTSYTPYQPEVSQGVLQGLFEYQTMVTRLTGMDIANASLYDGSMALVEAVNLATASSGKKGVLLSAGVNPSYRECVATFGKGTKLEVHTVPLKKDLTTAWPSPQGAFGAVVVGYPNYYGEVEDLDIARRVADEAGALLVVVTDPLALGLLRPPGDYGADVVVGEGQGLGLPLSFGGPYLGLFATRSRYVRLIPGRIVGETHDAQGRRGYVTTLRTREQDIRRERATSNVCTNQTLMALQATIFLSWLGREGFVQLARANYDATHYLVALLKEIPGIEVLTTNFVRDATVDLGQTASRVIERLMTRGFLAGTVVPQHPNWLLVSATEARTRQQIKEFQSVLSKELAR